MSCVFSTLIETLATFFRVNSRIRRVSKSQRTDMRFARSSTSSRVNHDVDFGREKTLSPPQEESASLCSRRGEQTGEMRKKKRCHESEQMEVSRDDDDDDDEVMIFCTYRFAALTRDDSRSHRRAWSRSRGSNNPVDEPHGS